MLGGGGEPCTLCSKRVYPAERINTVSGRVYHKTCFVCTKCTRKLTPSQCCEDGVTGRLYCEAHYRQLAKAAGLAGVASGGVDAAAGVLVICTSADSGLHKRLDVTVKENSERILSQCGVGYWASSHAGPPCSTWSAARQHCASTPPASRQQFASGSPGLPGRGMD